MSLVDHQIKAAILSGEILIYPYNEDNVSPGSYDVSLGRYIYSPLERVTTNSFVDPYDNDSIKNFWGEPEECYSSVDGEINHILSNDPITHVIKKTLPPNKSEVEYFVLLPGRTYLCHTEEFCGSKGNYSSIIQAKSSMGRNGLTVCCCASFIQPSFFGRITLEMRNNNNIPLLLFVGTKIAQIIFTPTTSVPEKSYSQTGRYQSSENIQKIVDEWTPEIMLPLNR